MSIPDAAVVQQHNSTGRQRQRGHRPAQCGGASDDVVQLGAKNGDDVEVTGGLDLGQEVVTRANFLVDSESQLRASLAAIGGH